MSQPGSADQTLFNQANGLDDQGGFLPWSTVRVLARTVLGDLDQKGAYVYPLGANGAMVAATPSEWDSITGAAAETSWRHIDPYGNVAELKKVATLLWYWLLDGCPTNMGPPGSPTSRIGLYMNLARRLRPWPEHAAVPTDPRTGKNIEAQHTYGVFPPHAETPLDTFSDVASDTIDNN